MNANSRFYMARRLPSIRLAEKATPLHIQRLLFTENSISVDGMVYTAKLFETLPSEASKEVHESIDEHGYIVNPNSVLYPGDVRMEHWKTSGAMQPRPQKDVQNLRLQLHVCPTDTIFEIAFTTKKFEVIKMLSDMFFGNRQAAWKVHILIPPAGIMRWPLEGMKPNVHMISIERPFLMDALTLIVDPSTLPIDIIRWYSLPSFEDLNHPTVTAAKELIFGEVYSREHLLQIRHPKVSVMRGVPAADLSAWVDQWMEERRSIGVHYSIRYVREPREQLEMISSRPEVLKKSERCVKLAMRATTTLVISYVEVPAQNTVWYLDMKVCQRDA
ncbi:unnamed protein product [Caenorhabditis nigoni]